MNDSKISIGEKHVVLLGLIAEGSIHAYGLEDKIRSRHMTEWTEIGLSSIYRVLSQIEDRGLVDSHLEHEGQGATRKVFAINDLGRRILSEAVLDHLSEVRPIKNPFQVALAFLSHAPRDEVLIRLQNRAREIERWVEEVSAFQKEEDGLDPASGKTLLLQHVLRHLRTEQEFIKDAVCLLAQQEVSP